MASEWAQERLRKWLVEAIDLNQRKIGFRIPELLDIVRFEVAVEEQLKAATRCAQLASGVADGYGDNAEHAVGAETVAVVIRREFDLK